MKIAGVELSGAATRGALIIAVAIVAGLGIGFIMVPRAPTTQDAKPGAPEVRLLGRPLRLDDQAVQRALRRVRRYAARRIGLRMPDGKAREYLPGRLGASIDKLRLTELVRDARDPTSPLRRVWQRSGKKGPLDLPVPVVVDVKRALPVLLVLKDELDRSPQDARLDLEKHEIVHEVPGRLLDVDATLGALADALGSGQHSAPLVFEHQKPRRVAAELGNVHFDHVLGYFETDYNRARRAAARTFNLRLAASRLDGHVLLPGETFDFNEVVGPRDEANGYKVAPVIAEGEIVDGIGGGTCQISGTLHGAAFFAGLDIVERYPHTRPSSYIKMGLDATVVYPTIDFRIRNSFKFPVVLHETVDNGKVRAEILGPRRTRTVTLIRHIDSAIPFEQVEREDKRLPSGVRVLSQRGVPGFKLHRYRIVRDGPYAVRERWDDVYPPTTQIIKVGTGDIPRGSVTIHGDRHPPYKADELLTMTQGPDVDARDNERGGATREWREAGKYGKDGWQEAAGMPVWHEGDDRDHEKKPREHRKSAHHTREHRGRSR